MAKLFRYLILASSVLSSAGCASYDDTIERMEFEKLRNYPTNTQEDRVLPTLDSDHGEEEATLRTELYGVRA